MILSCMRMERLRGLCFAVCVLRDKSFGFGHMMKASFLIIAVVSLVVGCKIKTTDIDLTSELVQDDLVADEEADLYEMTAEVLYEVVEEDTFEISDPVVEDLGTPMEDLGTPEAIDPTLDSDLDGVVDVQELADGTDPYDPASAMVWHPELDEHPRLFFDIGDLPKLRTRTTMTDGPWPVLWARIRSIADTEPPPYNQADRDIYADAVRGAIAEAAAFVGLLTEDSSYIQKALALIGELPVTDPLPEGSKYDLTGAEALVSFCTAFDYLAASPTVLSEDLDAARKRLIERIDTFRSLTHEGPLVLMVMLSRNNHTMKVMGALGLCAIVINDRPEAAKDMSEAITVLDWLLNTYQGNAEGGYAEGWHYLSYGGASFLPFIAAYHRFAKGQAFPYYGVPLLQADGPHAGKVVTIGDFVENPITRAIFKRALWSTCPDGLMPPTDDANPAALHGGLLFALTGDQDFLWQWKKTGFYSARAETATFSLYDGTEAPETPMMEIEGSKPDAGFAIFRDSWGQDALYLLLQGEHGVVRKHGSGHEHADELSFLIWAYGELLILDPGYISWDYHDKVRFSSDHNTILVDGLGSPLVQVGGMDIEVGADAFLSPMITDGPITWVDVRTNYVGVGFARRIVRVSGRIFVIEDAIDGNATSHTYSLLLNGMAGGDVVGSSFILLQDGAIWERNKAKVEARVIPLGGNGEMTVSSGLEEHQIGYGKWAMHERLKVDATMTEPAGFLTLILPKPTDALPWDVEVKRVMEGIGVASIRVHPEELEVLIVANHTGTDLELDMGGETFMSPAGLLVRVTDHENTTTTALPMLVPFVPRGLIN